MNLEKEDIERKKTLKAKVEKEEKKTITEECLISISESLIIISQKLGRKYR